MACKSHAARKPGDSCDVEGLAEMERGLSQPEWPVAMNAHNDANNALECAFPLRSTAAMPCVLGGSTPRAQERGGAWQGSQALGGDAFHSYERDMVWCKGLQQAFPS